MPTHETHENIDQIFMGIGNQQPDVHEMLDSLSTLLQSNHREVFHDWRTVEMMWLNTRDIKKTWSAFYHVILDALSMPNMVGRNSCVAVMVDRRDDGTMPIFDPEEFPPRLGEFFGGGEVNWEDND